MERRKDAIVDFAVYRGNLYHLFTLKLGDIPRWILFSLINLKTFPTAGLGITPPPPHRGGAAIHFRCYLHINFLLLFI